MRPAAILFWPEAGPLVNYLQHPCAGHSNRATPSRWVLDRAARSGPTHHCAPFHGCHFGLIPMRLHRKAKVASSSFCSMCTSARSSARAAPCCRALPPIGAAALSCTRALSAAAACPVLLLQEYVIVKQPQCRGISPKHRAKTVSSLSGNIDQSFSAGSALVSTQRNQRLSSPNLSDPTPGFLDRSTTCTIIVSLCRGHHNVNSHLWPPSTLGSTSPHLPTTTQCFTNDLATSVIVCLR
jgi:hypothetical protein